MTSWWRRQSNSSRHSWYVSVWCWLAPPWEESRQGISECSMCAATFYWWSNGWRKYFFSFNWHRLDGCILYYLPDASNAVLLWIKNHAEVDYKTLAIVGAPEVVETRGSHHPLDTPQSSQNLDKCLGFQKGPMPLHFLYRYPTALWMLRRWRNFVMTTVQMSDFRRPSTPVSIPRLLFFCCPACQRLQFQKDTAGAGS